MQVLNYTEFRKNLAQSLNRVSDDAEIVVVSRSKGNNGKPEPLKGDYSGCWSRRITDEHRLVYQIREGRLHILQCRFHYG